MFNIDPFLAYLLIEILLRLGELASPWFLDRGCGIASADIGFVRGEFKRLRQLCLRLLEEFAVAAGSLFTDDQIDNIRAVGQQFSL